MLAYSKNCYEICVQLVYSLISFLFYNCRKLLHFNKLYVFYFCVILCPVSGLSKK